MILTKQQKEIVTTKEKKVIVISEPATGKTRVLTERVKYLLDNNVPPEEIAMITFTNAAAYEMSTRIGEQSENMFIGTIHSLANKFLRGGGYDTTDDIENENFDNLFDIIEENMGCVKHYKYVLLDEAQDTSEIQFNFILNIINPENYMFVGDPKQSIYEFSGGRPDIFLELSEDKDVTVYELNQNYRNGYEILQFAKKIIYPIMEDNSVTMTDYCGEVVKMESELRSLVYLIKYSEDNYKDWFFLTRTNSQLDDVIQILKEEEIPCDTFKKATLSNGELYQKMNEDTVKVLTIHTAKGLENKNVIVLGAGLYSPEERKVSYVAATRAKEKLYWCNVKKKKKKTNYKSRIVQWD